MQLKFMVSHHKEEEKKLKSINPIIYFFMVRTKLLHHHLYIKVITHDSIPCACESEKMLRTM
jgi:hypothetical protein